MMKRSVPWLCLLIFPSFFTGGCGERAPATFGSTSDEEYCRPILARVDSFMAGYSDVGLDEDRYGGMAVVGTVADMAGMGPGDAGDVASAQHQQFVLLMTLVEFDENLEPVPYLAESWEISEDRTELTFRLRDGVFWQDGTRTTAYDVAFTYRTVTDPESGYPNPGFFQAYLPGEEGVQVLDSLTVRFRFKPHADLLETWRSVAILPRHLLEEIPARDLATHPYSGVCPVGNGPFRFLSRSPGESWTFVANPAFPDALGGRPFLDRYMYRVIPDQTTLLAELLTGGVDVYVQMLPNQAETARAEPNLRVVSFPYPSIFFIAWNSRVPKLSDPRVRRALTLGMNRRQLIQGVQDGEAILLNTGLPPVHWAFDPTLEDSLGYDPDGARALLTEAGWVDRNGDGIRENEAGEPLQIQVIYNQNQEREQVGEILRVQLREVGVDFRPTVLEMGAYRGVLTSEERDFEGAFVTFETGFRIDDRDLFHSDVVGGPWAFSGTRDPELDRYLDTLQLVPERDEALPLWRDYQLRLMELQPYTFLYSAYRRNGLNERLKGVVMDTRGDWATLRYWWISPEDRRNR